MPRLLYNWIFRKLAGESRVERLSSLQYGKFNCAAVIEMAHHLTAHGPKCYLCAKCGSHIGFNGCTGKGQIYDPAFILPSVIEGQYSNRIARRDTFMAPIFRQIQLVPVCEPSQLCGKLVFLAIRSKDRHGKTIRQRAGKDTLNATDVIDIGNDFFAKPTCVICYERAIARRHVDNLARIFSTILEHVTSIQLDMDTLEISTF